MNIKGSIFIAGVIIVFSIPLYGEETKEDYFFFGLRFAPIVSLSKEYNQTHDMDIGGGVQGGYQHEWFSVYGEFVPTYGFGGEVDRGGGNKEKYSTKGMWFNVNFTGKVMGNTDDLAMIVGAGGGFVQFSSNLSTYKSEFSWSANLRAGIFKRIRIGRFGVDLEARFSGIEFPPGSQKLILAIINFYWDFVF